MKRSTILLVIALVAVLGGSAVAYNLLGNGAFLADPFGAVSPSGGNSEEPGEEVDERIKAPDFTVEDMDGNEVTLSSMLGTPVVLNFWASWCPPCRSEMPEFDEVFGELGDTVQFMMVDAVGSRGETRENGAEYILSEGFSFPVYFDVNQEAVTQYGIRAFPTSILIDAEGYVVAGVEGAIDAAALRDGIRLLTEEQGSP